MKRLLLIALLAGLTIAIGCGDDDKSTDSNTKVTVGDPNDPEYLALVGQFSAVNDFVGNAISSAISLASSVGSGSPKATASEAVYHASSGFWYRTDTLIQNDSMSGYSSSWISEDSVQFWHGETAVQNPVDSLLTKVVSGTSANSSYTYGDDTTMLSIAQAMSFYPMGNDTIKFTGTANISFDYSSSIPVQNGTMVCSSGATFNLTATDILSALVGDEIDCPIGGSAVYTGTYETACTGSQPYSYSSSWEISTAFGNPVSTTTLTANKKQWTIKDTCGSSN